MTSSVPRAQRYFTVPVGPAPTTIPPGVAIIWCRCRAAIIMPTRYYSRPTPEITAAWAAAKAWQEFHNAKPHQWVSDFYRAPCRPHIGGCRNCGKTPAGRKIYYCSDACREEFDVDHFWGSARHATVQRARDVEGALSVPYCARGCGRFGSEVNHIAPLNGDRPHFGCCHHRENLELLCHACHLETTAEQRRLGLIG